MIYRHIIISALIFFAQLAIPGYAVEKGAIEYHGGIIDYSVIDGEKMKAEADYYWDLYEQNKDEKYLGTAMGKYYILTQIYPVEIYPMVQLARTYDEKNFDKFAKE